jgi:sporulation protein YqfC
VKKLQAIASSKKTNKFKRRFAEILDFPEDIFIDVPKIILTGFDSVHVENFSGISEYGKKKMKLKTKEGYIEILGEDLDIGTITPEKVTIKGTIHSCNFIR